MRTAGTVEGKVYGEARGWEQRKMNEPLGMFGLLDFTMLQPVLAWRAFQNLFL
jgi:hypothetical protein